MVQKKQFTDIMEEMKITFPKQDGSQGEKYVFYKNKRRLINYPDFIMVELDSGLFDNKKEVKEGNQKYEKNWFFGYFIDGDYKRLNDMPVRFEITPGVARNIKSYCDKFNVKFTQGNRFNFYPGNSYQPKNVNFKMTIYPMNIGILKSVNSDTNIKEQQKFKDVNTDVEDIELEDLM